MKIIRLLIIWALAHTLGSSLPDGPKIIAPVSEPKNWRLATKEDFVCNSGWEWNHRGKYVQLKSSILKKWDQIEVKGYLCMRNAWQATCRTNMLFSKEVSHRVEHESVDAESCFEAIREREHGRVEVETYPDPSCAWMSQITKRASHIHITPHPVGYDVYTNTLLSPSFPSGSCKIKTCCQTIYPKVVWVPSSPVKTQTTNLLFDEAVVKVTIAETKATEGSWVFGSLVTPAPLKGACKMTVSGKNGILLTNGFWFHSEETTEIPLYQAKAATETKVQANTIFSDIAQTTCSEGREFGLPKAEFVMHKSEALVSNMIYYQMCLESIQKIRSGEQITRIDLARMNPTVPGISNVYQLTRDGVRVGTTRYEMISWSPKVGLQTSLGLGLVPSTGKESEVIEWHDWKQTDDGIYNGPNGIIKQGTDLIHPNIMILGVSVDAILVAQHDLKPQPHPIVEALSDLVGEQNVTLEGDTTVAYLKSPISYFWEGIHWLEDSVHRAILFGSVAAAILLSILIAYLVSRLVRPKKSTKYMISH
ncbi:glycoprotein [Wufeng Rhinolophus pearsonii tupavirus 1]|uniref:Glycoprotein n=1 Tax=Wufeng Rhinolophus pearsonii tupavirus 1 TaxID=2877511 RepID=A0AAX2ZCF0_9RHAB|nr:glycoprotein [Wufeng Rhinolophus pearsonii tupavirus 1]UBB42391.1 glycoprotein [Wufeng Rhinolophus pearsonii tupavirus 1]WPV62764.1 MAG: glycoprotein [Wufeng bat tupavirus 1]